MADALALRMAMLTMSALPACYNRARSESCPTFPICGRPSPRKVFLQCFDQIACVHMSGLFVRSHMNAGQDGFRDESSKQMSDLIEGHWGMRSFSRHGS